MGSIILSLLTKSLKTERKNMGKKKIQTKIGDGELVRLPVSVENSLRKEGTWYQFCETVYRQLFKMPVNEAIEFAVGTHVYGLNTEYIEEERLREETARRKQAVESTFSEGGLQKSLEKLAKKEDVSEIEAMRWVSQNIETVNVIPEDAPSMFAWNLLVHVKSDEKAKNDFFKALYSKFSPTRVKVEDDKKEEDDNYDGVEQVSTIDKLMSMLGDMNG